MNVPFLKSTGPLLAKMCGGHYCTTTHLPPPPPKKKMDLSDQYNPMWLGFNIIRTNWNSDLYVPQYIKNSNRSECVVKLLPLHYFATYLLKAWLLSRCHNELGDGTLYVLLCIVWAHRLADPTGSAKERALLTRCLWTTKPLQAASVARISSAPLLRCSPCTSWTISFRLSSLMLVYLSRGNCIPRRSQVLYMVFLLEVPRIPLLAISDIVILMLRSVCSCCSWMLYEGAPLLPIGMRWQHPGFEELGVL